MEAILKAITPPDLNEGERWAGVQFVDGKPSHNLILLPGAHAGADHKTMLAWAESLGGDLPTPEEQMLLRANLPSELEADWYWSNKTKGSGYAWCANFSYGNQFWCSESLKLRGRAVRRSPIQ